jgi:2-methylisocitrate lyase-like PEP mutase family enzyme
MTTRIQEVARQVTIPIMADGDTGYGSPVNVRRTVQGFALAGAAGIMIEDQLWPKRCGHTKGKAVVSRDEAFARVRAAVDARNEGVDIAISAYRCPCARVGGGDLPCEQVCGIGSLYGVYRGAA